MKCHAPFTRDANALQKEVRQRSSSDSRASEPAQGLDRCSPQLYKVQGSNVDITAPDMSVYSLTC